MKNEFNNLPYNYDSLEPYIDAKTMEIHHSKHHKTYFDNFVELIKGTNVENIYVEELLSNTSIIPDSIKIAVLNNAGGFANHNLFWKILKKDVEFKGDVANAIISEFGSYENFKLKFIDAARTQFGSGWAWLVVNKNKKLEIIKTSNQDSPLSIGLIPILLLDVWEHAYYLKYQNRRIEYIENFFKIINWEKVNELYITTIKQ